VFSFVCSFFPQQRFFLVVVVLEREEVKQSLQISTKFVTYLRATSFMTVFVHHKKFIPVFISSRVSAAADITLLSVPGNSLHIMRGAETFTTWWSWSTWNLENIVGAIHNIRQQFFI